MATVTSELATAHLTTLRLGLGALTNVKLLPGVLNGVDVVIVCVEHPASAKDPLAERKYVPLALVPGAPGCATLLEDGSLELQPLEPVHTPSFDPRDLH